MGTVLLTHYALKTIPLFIPVNRSICRTERPLSLSVRRALSRSSFQEKNNVFAIVCQKNRPPDTLFSNTDDRPLHLTSCYVNTEEPSPCVLSITILIIAVNRKWINLYGKIIKKVLFKVICSYCRQHPPCIE